jgi:hypothetical protein
LYPYNTTTARIAEANQAHKEAICVYRTYNNVNQAFKKLIMDVFEDQFLNALSDEVVGYANPTSLDLPTRLITYYAIIVPAELTQNYERLSTPYDPNQPIEFLFQQIQGTRAFVIYVGQPYGDAMIVNVAYTLVFNTWLFPYACRAWKVCRAAQKTWTNFKIHFSAAASHQEFRLTNQTSQQSGLHSANIMIEHHPYHYEWTADAIAQLLLATASDRDMVTNLTATNSKLALQLETSEAYVQKLKEYIVQLKLKIKPEWEGQRPAKTMDTYNYCWSHGYQVHNQHTNASLNNQKEGHNEESTKKTPMGGVKLGNEWCAGAAKVLYHKLDQFSSTLDCTPPTSSVSMNDTAILDSGCTRNFLSATAPCTNKGTAHVPLHVNMPNGTIIQSFHTSYLLLSSCPPEVRRAHILPKWVHNSSISVGQLCNSGCDVMFTRDKVEVNEDG